MFYRRKVILALLQAFDGQMDKISHRRCFFLTQRQVKAEYDLYPIIWVVILFRNADLTTMVKKESYRNNTISEAMKLSTIYKP